MTTRLLVFAAVAALALVGCQRPRDTLRELQTEVSAYASDPSDEAARRIDEAFTRLDAQIDKLRTGGQADEAGELAGQRDALEAQYAAARMAASLLKAREAAANLGEAFRKAGEAFGGALKDSPGNDR